MTTKQSERKPLGHWVTSVDAAAEEYNAAVAALRAAQKTSAAAAAKFKAAKRGLRDELDALERGRGRR